MGKLLTEVDLSEQLTLSPLTLRDWRSQGRGPKFIKLPGKQPGTGYAVRYRQEDVDAWLAAVTAASVQREAQPPRAKRTVARASAKRKRPAA